MKNRMKNRKKEQKERNRDLTPNPATLDHSVASYDQQGSYGKPILLTLSSTANRGGIFKYYYVTNSMVFLKIYILQKLHYKILYYKNIDIIKQQQ